METPHNILIKVEFGWNGCLDAKAGRRCPVQDFFCHFSCNASHFLMGRDCSAGKALSYTEGNNGENRDRGGITYFWNNFQVRIGFSVSIFTAKNIKQDAGVIKSGDIVKKLGFCKFRGVNLLKFQFRKILLQIIILVSFPSAGNGIIQNCYHLTGIWIYFLCQPDRVSKGKSFHNTADQGIFFFLFDDLAIFYTFKNNGNIRKQ